MISGIILLTNNNLKHGKLTSTFGIDVNDKYSILILFSCSCFCPVKMSVLEDNTPN